MFRGIYTNFGTVFTFHVGQEYLAGVIVLAILLTVALVIIAYFVYQNRRLKSLKANPEKKSKERNDSKDINENSDKDDENYEQVEQSTYTALKKPGERDDDNHVYCHLNQVQKNNANQKETGI